MSIAVADLKGRITIYAIKGDAMMKWAYFSLAALVLWNAPARSADPAAPGTEKRSKIYRVMDEMGYEQGMISAFDDLRNRHVLSDAQQTKADAAAKEYAASVERLQTTRKVEVEAAA